MHMRQAAFTMRPGIKAHFGEGSIDRPHGSLRPLAPGRPIQAIFEHDLYQPMYVEHPGFGITLDQRVTAQSLDSLIEQQRINRYCSEYWPQALRSLRDDCFRDSIWFEEGT